jgi:hypothetical protein
MVDLAPKWAKPVAVLGLEIALEQLEVSVHTGFKGPEERAYFLNRLTTLRRKLVMLAETQT